MQDVSFWRADPIPGGSTSATPRDAAPRGGCADGTSSPPTRASGRSGEASAASAAPFAAACSLEKGATCSVARRATAVDSTNSAATATSSRDARGRRPLITSAVAQSCFFFGGAFAFAFVIFCLLILPWKGRRLPYGRGGFNWWALDVAFLVAYAVVEPRRLALASVANKALRARWMSSSVALAAPALGLHAYYAWWQTHALKMDVFLNVCGMGFVGTHSVLSLFAVRAFPGSFGSARYSGDAKPLCVMRARLDANRRGDGSREQSAKRVPGRGETVANATRGARRVRERAVTRLA